MFVGIGHYCVCVQVCYRIDDLNMKREMEGLKSKLDYFRIRKGEIITQGQADTFDYEGVTIKSMPAIRYLV